LPVVDTSGERTGRQAVSHTLGLLTMSLGPVVFGVAGLIYGVGALLLGIGFLVLAMKFSRRLTRESARALFFASIIYLPLLLALLVFDKVKP
jgi:heme o synthase